MRRLAITLVIVSLWSSTAAADVPSIETPVNDLAGVLSRPDIEQLDQLLVRARVDTGAQIALLVIRTTGGVPIEDYALQVAEKWGGGSGKRSDGVLLVLAIDDRQSRLDVGYDLEDRITDGRARQILDGMRPALRATNYIAALSGAVTAVAAVLEGLEPAVAYEPETPRTSSGGSGSSGGSELWVGIVIVIVFVVVVVVMIKSARSGRGGGGGGASSSSGSGGRIALDVALTACQIVASSSGSSSGWSSGSSGSSWGGGSSSGGSSSGGSSSPGWGGGGGSFGGGGASSSW